MIHKGIEYKIAMIEPGLWKYEFCIGAFIRTGCSLELLAERRVRQKIDRLLRTPSGRSQKSRSSRRMASVLDIMGSGRAPRPVKTRGASRGTSGS
jgi:hypothetical protein